MPLQNWGGVCCASPEFGRRLLCLLGGGYGSSDGQLVVFLTLVAVGPFHLLIHHRSKIGYMFVQSKTYTTSSTTLFSRLFSSKKSSKLGKIIYPKPTYPYFQYTLLSICGVL